MISSNIKISCAILAGGEAKRFNGENKALLQVGEKNNLDKIIQIADGFFDEILLITNHPELYSGVGTINIYTDLIRGVGPLGGIHSAITNAENEAVFFLPCDMPFLSSEMIGKEIGEYLKNDCEIIIPRIGELIEPLHSIFSTGLKCRLEEHIRSTNNYSIRKFFQRSVVYYWDIEDSPENRKVFFNINTHHDLDNAKKMI